MNFQYDFPSNPIALLKYYYVLVFDFFAMQDATESFITQT